MAGAGVVGKNCIPPGSGAVAEDGDLAGDGAGAASGVAPGEGAASAGAFSGLGVLSELLAGAAEAVPGVVVKGLGKAPPGSNESLRGGVG